MPYLYFHTGTEIFTMILKMIISDATSFQSYAKIDHDKIDL